MQPGAQTDDKEAYARQFPVHVGVDTGKEFHKLVARGPDGRRTKAVRVEVGRESFEAADQFLSESFAGIPRAQMLVGFEFAGHHGMTFAHFLAERGYQIVTVLPSVTKKLKEVEDNSPRKDDAKDAAQICRLVGSGLFVGFALLDERAAALRTLTTERERLTREQTRLKNRLHSLLDLVWPEFLGHFHALTKATPQALLARWVTPYELLAERPETVRAFVVDVSRNHIQRGAVDALLVASADTVGLTVGLEARASEIRRLMTRWALLQAHLAAVDERLATLVDAIPAAKALTTVPGVSVVCAATLVAELGDPMSYVSPRQVLKLAGMNLAGKQSGISVHGRVKQTKRGRPALRRQLFLLAGRWC
jgi:transposase